MKKRLSSPLAFSVPLLGLAFLFLSTSPSFSDPEEPEEVAENEREEPEDNEEPDEPVEGEDGGPAAGISSEQRMRAQSLSHRVERVTAYTNLALVTRVAKVALKKGGHWVRLLALPQEINPQSVQVKLTGGAGTRIAQVLMEDSYEKVGLKPDLQAKVKDLRGLYAQLLELEQQAHFMRDRTAFLRALTFDPPFPKNTPANAYKPFSAKMESLSTALEATQSALLEWTEAERRLQEKIRKVEEVRSLRHREVESATSTSDQKWLRHLYVLIDSPSVGTGTLEVGYLLPGATWRPIYDVRADLDREAGKASIKLVTAGMVEQHTGEDWQKVRLTLSTLDPVPLYLPKLTRWTLAESRREEDQLRAPKDARDDFGRANQKPMEKSATPSRERANKDYKRKALSAPGGGGATTSVVPAPAPSSERAGLDEAAGQEADSPYFADDRAASASGIGPMGKVAPQSVENYKKLQADGGASGSHRFPLGTLEQLYSPLASLQRSVASAVKTSSRPVDTLFRRSSLDDTGANEGGRLIELASPFLVDLEHDAQPYKIPLRSQVLQGALLYFAIPKRDPAVFLRAKTTNTTSSPILGGIAQVFMDGDLVSRTELETIDEKGHFTVDLGVDRNIEVKRIVDRKSKTKGILRKDHVTDVDVRIEVVNRHGFPITLELVDQFPLSPDEKVKVTLEKVSPQIEPDDDGTLEWKMKVPAGKKSTFKFRYKVVHPESFLVSELN